jgi:hypothetical protein
MVRFTLRRPSQNSAVSTCCDAMSCRDVSGRVQLGVRPVPARSAHEPRLALATAGSDVLAGVTGRRRVRSCEFLDPAGCLLFQPGHEQTPTGCEDAPVEAGLGCEVPARLLHGSGSGASHTFDVEVLDPDHVEPAGTRPRRSPTSSTPSKASHPPGCGTTSSAGSTGRGCVAVSGPRRTSAHRTTAHHCTLSRTTSQARNDPTWQGFRPALKGGVPAPDHR